jgi:hypothetical protein
MDYFLKIIVFFNKCPEQKNLSFQLIFVLIEHYNPDPDKEIYFKIDFFIKVDKIIPVIKKYRFN